MNYIYKYINNINIKLEKKTIYLVPNNIGNILDLSLRILYILNNVDIILSEDTRVLYNIFKFYNIKNKVISFNSYNEKYKYIKIINYIIKNNINVALIPNKGSPILNDPGKLLIEYAVKNNINIISIPGCNSIISSIICSNFDISKFIFEGFIPKKNNDKIKLFNKLKFEKKTIIFFENYKRLKNSLENMKNIFNNRNIVICKDISKKYEKILRTNINDLINTINNNNNYIKGELTIILEGNINKINTKKIKILKIFNILKKYIKYNKNIVKIISEIFNIKKNKIFNIVKNIKLL